MYSHGIARRCGYGADSLLEKIQEGSSTVLDLRRDDSLNFATGFLTGTTAGGVSTEQRYTIYGELESVTSTTTASALWEVE